MRKINTRDFRIATRTTSRDINRRIALNLIREHQPISRAYLAGEIIGGWDLIEDTVRQALAERALTDAAARTPVLVASAQEYPRLRGAAALIAAPTFAAPRVA